MLFDVAPKFNKNLIEFNRNAYVVSQFKMCKENNYDMIAAGKINVYMTLHRSCMWLDVHHINLSSAYSVVQVVEKCIQSTTTTKIRKRSFIFPNLLIVDLNIWTRPVANTQFNTVNATIRTNGSSFLRLVCENYQKTLPTHLLKQRVWNTLSKKSIKTNQIWN